MSEAPEVVRSLIEADASRFAFQIGQAVEAVLIDRAFRLALLEVDTDRQTVVMSRHVRRALDDSVFEEACARVGVVLNDGARGGRSEKIAS